MLKVRNAGPPQKANPTSSAGLPLVQNLRPDSISLGNDLHPLAGKRRSEIRDGVTTSRTADRIKAGSPLVVRCHLTLFCAPMKSVGTTTSVGRLTNFSIEKLFGETNVDLRFPDDAVSIIYGANGSGKSTGMRLLRDAMSQQQELLGMQLDLFESATLGFASGAQVEIDAKRELLIEKDSPTASPRRYEVNARGFAEFIDRETPFQMSQGVVVHSDGSRVDQETLLRMRKHFEISRIRSEALPRSAGRNQRVSEPQQRQLVKPCTLIGSDRLRVAPVAQQLGRLRMRPDWDGVDPDPRGIDAFAVGRVRRSLIKIIGDAREEARKASERLDNDYFKRLLATIRNPASGQSSVDQDALRSIERRLVKCALATSELDLPDIDIGQFELAERRVIQAAYSLYLADLWQKLSKTTRVLDKLEFFLDLLNDHFNGKRAVLSLEAGLNVNRESDSFSIPLHRLSSGEQHLIVIFHSVLFEAADDGICLIDEPEISLNVDWQMRFVDSLRHAARLAGTGQQFVIATHSPTLVGDHSDVCIEFGGLDES